MSVFASAKFSYLLDVNCQYVGGKKKLTVFFEKSYFLQEDCLNGPIALWQTNVCWNGRFSFYMTTGAVNYFVFPKGCDHSLLM